LAYVARRAGTATIELLDGDLVAIAQCIAIDADAFPYASAHFGLMGRARSRSGRVWIARDAADERQRVVGFLAARLRGRRGQAHPHLMHIEGLAVDQPARQQGIGRALVREAVADARARRLHAVVLHVSVTNEAAIALYESEGFGISRKLPGFYPAGAFDGVTEALEMAKVLR
jgi:ribosomal protein S18 acetylase RimI-like enzyme